MGASVSGPSVGPVAGAAVKPGYGTATGRRIGKRRRADGDQPMRTARINLLIAPHEREAWHAAAERAGVSLSEYVRVAVEARLTKETR